MEQLQLTKDVKRIILTELKTKGMIFDSELLSLLNTPEVYVEYKLAINNAISDLVKANKIQYIQNETGGYALAHKQLVIH